MRALMLTPHLDRVGGTERQCLLLSRELEQHGVRTRILTRAIERPPVHAEVSVERLPAPLLVRVKNTLRRAAPSGGGEGGGAPPGPARRPGAMRRVQAWMEARQIYDFARRAREQVYHLHGAFWPPMLIGAADAAVATGRPMLVKIANEAERSFRILEQAPGGVEALSKVSVIVTLSRAMRDYFVAKALGPRVELIANGVDLAPVTPLGSEPRLLFAGRLVQQKGVDVLLAALAEVPGATLDILGDGEDQPALERRAGELGVADRVRFRGETQVEPYLRRARVLVLPSRWEGMPNALLEGMAWGRACVATTVAGSADLVTDGVNGLLVPPDDTRALAAALRRALHEPGLGERLAAAARARIAEEYGVGRIAERYRQLYLELGA